MYISIGTRAVFGQDHPTLIVRVSFWISLHMYQVNLAISPSNSSRQWLILSKIYFLIDDYCLKSVLKGKFCTANAYKWPVCVIKSAHLNRLKTSIFNLFIPGFGRRLSGYVQRFVLVAHRKRKESLSRRVHFCKDKVGSNVGCTTQWHVLSFFQGQIHMKMAAFTLGNNLRQKTWTMKKKYTSILHVQQTRRISILYLMQLLTQ